MSKYLLVVNNEGNPVEITTEKTEWPEIQVDVIHQAEDWMVENCKPNDDRDRFVGLVYVDSVDGKCIGDVLVIFDKTDGKYELGSRSHGFMMV